MQSHFLKIGALASIMVFTVSCKDNPNEVEAAAAKSEAEAPAEATTYTVNTDMSSIVWVGSKPTEEHTGNISLASGMVKVLGEELQSGEFVINMTSIQVTDLEGAEATKLKAHLEGTAVNTATDFFNTPKYPTAKFAVTGLKNTDGKAVLQGNLTLKDVTKNVSFPVKVAYEGDKMMLNSEEFTIDRTDWGIQYGSAKLADVIADKAISDNIKLTINLVATKS